MTLNTVKSLLIGYTAFQLAERGADNLLGTVSLKHGTSIGSYLKIRYQGGLPNNSEQIGSGYHFFTKEVKGYFFVLKENVPLLCALIRPRVHVMLTAENNLEKTLIDLGEKFALSPGTITGLKIAALCITPLLQFLLVPTLNFHFAPNEITRKRFQNDPDYDEAAYRTKERIEPWRLGIIGSLITGLNTGWWGRAKEHPGRALIGAMEIGGAASLLYYTYRSAGKVSLLTGMLLA